MLRVALAVVTLLSTLAGPAAAEHEVYYRYTVLGYVKDARGKPQSGRDVVVVRDKTGFTYLGETDAKGFYVVVVRLGDESLGEKLTVKVGRASTRLVARFEPADRAEERGTRVDLDGARFVERSAWFRSTLAGFLGAAGR